jgi:hypothetical protein
MINLFKNNFKPKILQSLMTIRYYGRKGGASAQEIPFRDFSKKQRRRRKEELKTREMKIDPRLKRAKMKSAIEMLDSQETKKFVKDMSERSVLEIISYYFSNRILLISIKSLNSNAF